MVVSVFFDGGRPAMVEITTYSQEYKVVNGRKTD